MMSIRVQTCQREDVNTRHPGWASEQQWMHLLIRPCSSVLQVRSMHTDHLSHCPAATNAHCNRASGSHFCLWQTLANCASDSRPRVDLNIFCVFSKNRMTWTQALKVHVQVPPPHSPNQSVADPYGSDTVKVRQNIYYVTSDNAAHPKCTGVKLFISPDNVVK